MTLHRAEAERIAYKLFSELNTPQCEHEPGECLACACDLETLASAIEAAMDKARAQVLEEAAKAIEEAA